MKKILLIAILVCFISLDLLAQKGYLRGKVSDAENGEALIGAAVIKQGTTVGAVADFDGNYSLPLEPGTHTIVFQYVAYQTKTVEGVVITADEVTTLDVNLSTNVEQLSEVVVIAEALNDSEAAILAAQKKSPVVMDGISSQAFRKIGDGNLSGAMKRVTGVSVQGGKYVYVRGLGDRYTRTTLNGMSIPGLDPERNDVQIDLFPTSILENVKVYKTFSPDLAGDFTGGTVNIETKSFPEENATRVTLGLGYNPNMNLVKDFILYDGGKTDFLGFDDGTRDLPLDDPIAGVPYTYDNDPQLEILTRKLNPIMAAAKMNSFLNSKFSFNHGNQIDKGNYKIGYGVVLNYQNSYEYYDNAQISNLYFKDSDKDVIVLDPQMLNKGQLAKNDVLWSGLVTGAIKFNSHQFGVRLLRTQNGISGASQRLKQDLEETGQTVYQDILTYTQRSILNPTIYGKHQFNKLSLEWSNSYSISRVYDPDYRISELAEIKQYVGTEEVDPYFSIDAGKGGGVRRFWRDLNEDNENFKVDLSYEISDKNKIKFGGAGLLKWRTFDTYAFQIKSTERIPNDPDYLLQPENIWTVEKDAGTYLSGNYEAANNYEGRSSVYAGYILNDVHLNDKFRAIYGLRVEQAKMYYTGENNFGTIIYDDQETLNKLNYLPSVNLVYSFTDNMNLRASYGRTLARPSFREKSIAQIIDPISGILWNGNIDLDQTDVNNFDLRIEDFFGNDEMFAVSAFYKRFQGHIEQVRYQVEFSQVTWQNAGMSEIFGLEFEFRKNLDFLVRGVSAGSNISLAKSNLDMSEIIVDKNSGLTELEARRAQARNGETIDKTRPMAGQAPYLINAFLNYSDKDNLSNINFSYNVQGETLYIVGVAQVPDVYLKPFHSLNLNVSRRLHVDSKSMLTLRVDNILGSQKRQVWKNYKSPEEVFTKLNPGRTFTLKYTFSF